MLDTTSLDIELDETLARHNVANLALEQHQLHFSEDGQNLPAIRSNKPNHAHVTASIVSCHETPIEFVFC